MSFQTSTSEDEGISTKADFYNRFAIEQKSLQEQIERLKDTSLAETERQSLLGNCLSGVSNLSDEVKNASSDLPAYEQRTYSAAIKSLTEKLQSARSTSAPKRKFAFRKFAPEEQPVEDTSTMSPAPLSLQSSSSRDATSGSSKHEANARIAPSPSHSDTVSISSLTSVRHVLQADALRPATSVTEISRSFIDLSISMTSNRPFSTLSVKNVSESLLLCGQVSGAAHVTGVANSALMIYSRQVRLHECKDCVVYLRCSSRPVIEDCHGIKFAPLPASFVMPSDEAATDATPNLWNQVDDFQWLRAEHSPNWSILPPDDERAIDHNAWKEIMAGQDFQLSLDDLLKAAKILI